MSKGKRHTDPSFCRDMAVENGGTTKGTTSNPPSGISYGQKCDRSLTSARSGSEERCLDSFSSPLRQYLTRCSHWRSHLRLLDVAEAPKDRLIGHGGPKTPETRASCTCERIPGSFANEPVGSARDTNVADDAVKWLHQGIRPSGAKIMFVIGRKAPCCASGTLVTKFGGPLTPDALAETEVTHARAVLH